LISICKNYNLFKYLSGVFFYFLSAAACSQNIPPYTFTLYDSSATGYYFISGIKLGNPAGYISVQLVLDSKGSVVYFKTHPSNERADDFKIQPNGVITYFSGSKFYILDSTFTVVDSVACIGYATDGHDLQIVNNNHYLLLGSKDSIMDLTSYHYFNHNGSIGSPNATVTGNVIQELDSNKNLVFEWSTFEHFLFSDVSVYWLSDPSIVDWTHCNAVEMDFDGNILLSTRHFNEITKIDRSTGYIIWRMGGNQNEFVFMNDSLTFRGQHDVRRLATGNITLFDNGRYFFSHSARGVEYAIDEINKIATLVWSYSQSNGSSSIATGNVQRISNNRTMIDFGKLLDNNICFTLVDSANNKLSELFFADSSISYRSFFYPQLPWNLNRPQINCFSLGSSFYLEPVGTFSDYLWSNGETTSSIEVTDTGTYYLFVPYGEGFIKSEIFTVTDLLNPCNTNSVNEIENGQKISITPDPVSDYLIVKGNFIKDSGLLKFYDVYGHEINFEIISHSKYEMRINTHTWSSGIYLLKAGQEVRKFVKN
jgi:hypothetical protein